MAAAILKCVVGLVVMLMGLFLIVTPLIVGAIFLTENQDLPHRAESFAIPASIVCWFVGGVTTLGGLITVLLGLRVKPASIPERSQAKTSTSEAATLSSDV